MNNGWVKLPRSLLESCVLRQPEILQVFIYAILQARFKETVVTVNRCTVALEPGQCVFLRKAWAYELHISEKIAYRALHKLEEYGLVKIRATTKYTVLTIVDWEFYETPEFGQAMGQQTDSKMDNKRTELNADTERKSEDIGTPNGQQNGQQMDSKRTQKKKDNNINNNIYNIAFEKFWERYPNRFNRQQTHKNFVKAAKAHGVDVIMQALNNYCAEIEAKGTAAEYIVRSTNFVGQKAYFLGYLEQEKVIEIAATEIDTPAHIAKEWGYE